MQEANDPLDSDVIKGKGEINSPFFLLSIPHDIDNNVSQSYIRI